MTIAMTGGWSCCLLIDGGLLFVGWLLGFMLVTFLDESGSRLGFARQRPVLRMRLATTFFR